MIEKKKMCYFCITPYVILIQYLIPQTLFILLICYKSLQRTCIVSEYFNVHFQLLTVFLIGQAMLIMSNPPIFYKVSKKHSRNIQASFLLSSGEDKESKDKKTRKRKLNLLQWLREHKQHMKIPEKRKGSSCF